MDVFSYTSHLDEKFEDYVWHVWVMNISMAILYWVFGSLYVLMDLTKKPSFLQKYKMNRHNEVPMTWPLLKDMTVVILINQFIVGISVSTILYPTLPIRGLPPVRKMPTIPEFFFELYGCWLVREYIFFHMHRLIHRKSLYKHIHKKHHRWTAPIALSAEYCTPAEYTLCNLLPAMAGPLVIAPHYFSVFLWYVHVMLSTLQKHSGYNIPWYYDSMRHEMHHENFRTNYGLIGIMDWWYGTNDPKSRPNRDDDE